MITVFDIETTGFRASDSIVCIVAKSFPGEEFVRWSPGPDQPMTARDACEFLDYIAASRVVVSHNGLMFDVPRVQALAGRPFKASHFDLLHEIRRATGNIRGWSLDAIARAMLGESSKPDNLTGADMPRLYAEGRIDEVVKACRADVYQLGRILNRVALRRGTVESLTCRARIPFAPIAKMAYFEELSDAPRQSPACASRVI